LAEVGTDWSRFPTAQHVASWAGICPGNYESGGKSRPEKSHRGNRWLRRDLVQAAHRAARTKNCALQAFYHRLKRRRGAQKAAVAVGHRLLVIAYHLLRRHDTYHERGADYYDQRQREQVQRQAVRRLEPLGYQVTITDTKAA
jgi:hypothetical protein